MDESDDIMKTDGYSWLDVLKLTCHKEVYESYLSLRTREAQEKMVDALRSKVMNTLMDCRETTNQRRLQPHISHQPSTHHSSESTEVLRKTVNAEGLVLTLDQVRKIKAELERWGVGLSKQQTINKHEQANIVYKSKLSGCPGYKNITSDATVTKEYHWTRGTRKLSRDMKRISVKDLQLFEVNRGFYVEGTLIGDPRIVVGVTTLLEDHEGNVVQISLYNVIPQGPDKITLAENIYPRGLEIKIIEPFFKIFRDGNRGIRVDDPCDVCVMSQSSRHYEDCREKGKQFMKSGHYMMAFEVYLDGLKELSDDIVPLLNNRSQTEIKLRQYEEALLDSAAVMFFKPDDEKAQQRYHYAIRHIESDGNEVGVKDIWIRIIKTGITVSDITEPERVGCKETGNDLYLHGDYKEAKKEYTSAISSPEVCILLTNIAIVSLKLELFHTAIAAAATCLRITRRDDYERKQKAYHNMCKAFIMSNQIELYKHCSSQLDNSLELDRLLDTINNREDIFRNTILQCLKVYPASITKTIETCSKSNCLVSDFILADALEHTFVEGKGRGILATRNIKSGELILVDHPIACRGINPLDTNAHACSRNFKTRLEHNSGHVNLIAKLLNLVKHDAILTKKLMCLESRSNGEIPLVRDLSLFGYRQLSFDVLPFLTQSHDHVSVEDREIVDDSFVKNLLDVNAFEHDVVDKDAFSRGRALCLRVSLFNHDELFNCRVLPFGESVVLFAIKEIPKGSELTICYSNDGAKWGFTKS